MRGYGKDTGNIYKRLEVPAWIDRESQKAMKGN
jgi:hypothetical protein